MCFVALHLNNCNTVLPERVKSESVGSGFLISCAEYPVDLRSVPGRVKSESSGSGFLISRAESAVDLRCVICFFVGLR